jgi:hypothetical protein
VLTRPSGGVFPSQRGVLPSGCAEARHGHQLPQRSSSLSLYDSSHNAGVGTQLAGALNVDALLEAAHNLDFITSLREDAAHQHADPSHLAMANHSMAVLRVFEIQRWCAGPQFKSLMRRGTAKVREAYFPRIHRRAVGLSKLR